MKSSVEKQSIERNWKKIQIQNEQMKALDNIGTIQIYFKFRMLMVENKSNEQFKYISNSECWPMKTRTLKNIGTIIQNSEWEWFKIKATI